MKAIIDTVPMTMERHSGSSLSHGSVYASRPKV
jgi:hypothetical protein